MKLHEYQSKRLLAEHGVPVPEGQVATSPREAAAAAQSLGGRVVVKAQALVGGRGKAGGIVLVSGPQEAERVATDLLGRSLKGVPVQAVLVERAADIAHEVYLGVAVDRTNCRVTLMASAEGGVDIEETARMRPEAIHTLAIEPYAGLHPFQARTMANTLGLARDLWRGFSRVAQALYVTAGDVEAVLAEINPLVVTADHQLLAVDAKIVLDDNALYRHPDLVAMRDPSEDAPAERAAGEAGISYVKLDGSIGCMVNGAGLAMATMDVIQLFGGEPANFLDIGGGARSERVAKALGIILSDPNVTTVLINIFGGITRCDEVASGILDALETVPRRVPFVVRLVGTNEHEGRELLRSAQLEIAVTLAEGARQAVALAGGSR